jgi:hypothetical protein
VTGIYPLNFDEDEFVSSVSVINRTVWYQNQPIASSSPKVNNEEGPSAGFVGKT